MSSKTGFLSLAVALALVAGCAPSPPTGESSDALTIGVRLSAVADAQIVGASADRRRIAYAWPCTSDGRDAPPSLAMRDDWTGAVTMLGTIAHCAPGHVTFSADGNLASWPKSDGVAVAWNAHTGALSQVSRDGMHAIALSFSPDSRWLVVASTAQPPTAYLDAWDADLTRHVEIGGGIYVNPFGPGSDLVQFSPDARRILYLGDVTTPYPIGTLTEWTRTSPTAGRARVLARGVAAYVVDEAFARVARLDGVTVASGPPSDWLHGRLAVERLADGALEVLESDAPAVPQYFAPDGTLVYFVGPLGNTSPRELKLAAPAGTPRTVDHDVFQGYGPSASAALSPDGSAVAYVAAVDQTLFAGQLRVAPLSARGGAPTVVARDVVPTAFGWVDDTVGFLHASTSSFPAVGALALWSPGDRAARDLATGVTQVGLAFDRAAGRVVYFDHWDENRAAGDLRRWSSASGRARLLGHDAFAMTLAWSPDDTRAGVQRLGPQTDPATPPRTTLVVVDADGTGTARTVARDTTSFVVSDGGRVLYTTAAGLWAALVL
jgi:hypothetical protein